MTDFDDLFKPENKFLVSTTITLESHQALQLRKFINLYYLGDEDANILVDGHYVAKYPEKETKEFKDATWRISGGYKVNLFLEFDTEGNPKFEVVSDD